MEDTGEGVGGEGTIEGGWKGEKGEKRGGKIR